MKYLIKVQFIVFCLFSTFEGASQKVAAYNNPELQYQNGLELFNKNQFVSAQKCFQEYIQTSKVSLLKSDASFYSAACAKDVGWRIDYQLATPSLRSRLTACSIERAQQFSDHAPFSVDYSGS